MRIPGIQTIQRAEAFELLTASSIKQERTTPILADPSILNAVAKGRFNYKPREKDSVPQRMRGTYTPTKKGTYPPNLNTGKAPLHILPTNKMIERKTPVLCVDTTA
eukprot:TRINITY_DN235_c0_g1_i1.p1 TRINITY_DN235_c0_g1~~TRINITY_DN235_c0_g1_i1.p1  ORF type:complete len:106 (+),score=17.50 TRINITY_DN235_c0_g1_i1:897-1214(+)